MYGSRAAAAAAALLAAKRAAARSRVEGEAGMRYLDEGGVTGRFKAFAAADAAAALARALANSAFFAYASAMAAVAVRYDGASSLAGSPWLPDLLWRPESRVDREEEEEEDS